MNGNFRALPIIGILRGIDESVVIPLADTIISSGLKTIEITMNTPGADKLLYQLNKHTGDRLAIGAGTVVSMKDLQKALTAGASFIVTPCIIDEVINYCVKNTIPVFPGALTPTEVHKAWHMGASMVKVFPASVYGPGYFKDLRGPFDDIKTIAVGGVNADNIAEYFENGASGVAFGASIFKRGWIEEEKFENIENAIKSLIYEYEQLSD